MTDFQEPRTEIEWSRRAIVAPARASCLAVVFH